MLCAALAMAALSSLSVTVSAPTAAYAQSAQLRVVAGSLLQFENAVTWASVSRAWVGQRGGWQRSVRSATTPQELAQLLIGLETQMGWGSVQPSWRQARPAWVAATQAATTEAEVAQALMRLEAVTKWEAVSAAWRTQRTPWVATLQSVR